MGVCKRLWNCFKYDNSDVTAWMKICVARGPTTTVIALFTSTALIFLAESLDTDCDKRVDLGLITLRTSSVLAATQVVENIFNVVLTPIFGALADGSDHRKALLIASNAVWVSGMFVSGLLLFVEPSLTMLWFFFLALLFVVIFYELALMLIFSYLPEIIHDESELTKISSRQYAIVNAIQLLIAGILVGVTLVVEFDDDLPYTIIAHMLCVSLWLYFAIPGIIALPSRKASGEMRNPFKKLHATAKEIKEKYPQVGFFLLSWMFYFSGILSVTVLQVSYLTDEFGYSTSDVSYLGASLLLFSVFGAALAEILSKKIRLKVILMGTVIFWAFAGILAPLILRGQDLEVPKNETDENAAGCLETELIEREPREGADMLAYLISIFFGIGIGLVYPVNVSIYSLIVPGGEEATFFSLKSFSVKVLSWAPPLLFTAINESTENLQLSFMSLSLWFLLALPFLYFLDVEQGMRDVEHTLHLRRGVKHVEKIDFDDRDSVLEKEHKALETVNPMHQVVTVIEPDDDEEVAEEDVDVVEVKEEGVDAEEHKEEVKEAELSIKDEQLTEKEIEDKEKELDA